MKNKLIWRIFAVVILLVALLLAVQMIYTRTPLDYSMLLHWIFIICFLFTLLVNIRGKHLVGLSIGLSGLFLLVTSLVIRAL